MATVEKSEFSLFLIEGRDSAAPHFCSYFILDFAGFVLLVLFKETKLIQTLRRKIVH